MPCRAKITGNVCATNNFTPNASGAMLFFVTDLLPLATPAEIDFSQISWEQLQRFIAVSEEVKTRAVYHFLVSGRYQSEAGFESPDAFIRAALAISRSAFYKRLKLLSLPPPLNTPGQGRKQVEKAKPVAVREQPPFIETELISAKSDPWANGSIPEPDDIFGELEEKFALDVALEPVRSQTPVDGCPRCEVLNAAMLGAEGRYLKHRRIEHTEEREFP